MKVKVKEIASVDKNHKIIIDSSKVINPEIKTIQNLSLEGEIELPSLEQQAAAMQSEGDLCLQQ